MPALAAVVPAYVDSIMVCADADLAGQRGATDLVAGLSARRIEARAVIAAGSAAA
jgi:hypothetical protein